MNKQKLDDCLYQAVQLTDCDSISKTGWLVIRDKDYLLLPFDDILHVYIYKASHIKTINFLTNGIEIK